MPIYEFECGKCGKPFEELLSSSSCFDVLGEDLQQLPVAGGRGIGRFTRVGSGQPGGRLGA